jgi:glycine cleavage system H protein
MSSVPSDLRYTNEHEWVRPLSESTFRVGITDYAQGALGDIVYIQLPKLGERIEAGKVCGEVESTKSVSEIYSPLTGKVINVNSDLESTPEVINSQPYEMGWIFEIEIEASADLASLLTAEQYASLTA